jgi:hypothetical protein
MPTDIRIYTGSWRATIDPIRFVRVGISRSVPRGLRGYRRLSALEPGSWWRSIEDPIAWEARYQTDVLDKLDPHKTVDQLRAMSDGRDVVLCCWEASPPDRAWCHRAFVSRWLHREVGLEVHELGHEHCGCGTHHPKLPRDPFVR